MNPLEPNPDPAVEPKTVRMRRVSYDPASTIEVILRQRKATATGEDEFDVYAPHPTEDLTLAWIGVVGSYTGSLDRKISIAGSGRSFRKPGKRRTLWSAQGPSDTRPWNQRVSRAEAIRLLLDFQKP